MRRPAAQLLEELRRLDEHERIEAKRGLGKEALATVIAFSNEPGLGGGYILFGSEAEDDSYVVVGVDDPDGLSATLANQCADETLNRPLRPEIWTEELEGARVVVAYVPELPAGEKPVYKRGLGCPRGAYRRVGSTDQQGTDEDLQRYRDHASPRPYEDTLVPDADMEDLDPEAIAKYYVLGARALPLEGMRAEPEQRPAESLTQPGGGPRDVIQTELFGAGERDAAGQSAQTQGFDAADGQGFDAADGQGFEADEQGGGAETQGFGASLHRSLHHNSPAAGSEDVVDAVAARVRAPRELVEEAILLVCRRRFATIREIASRLQRSSATIRNRYIPGLVAAGRLELRDPENPTSPEQAYRTVEEGE